MSEHKGVGSKDQEPQRVEVVNKRVHDDNEVIFGCLYPIMLFVVAALLVWIVPMFW